jgi:plastocyanin
MQPARRLPHHSRRDPRPPFLLAMVVGLWLGASSAGAGPLRGTVHVPAAPKDGSVCEPYPGRANALAGHSRPPRGAIGDAIVYLEALPAAADSALPLPVRPKLAQQDQSFQPRVIAVPVGGSVDFPNLDPIYHNVFSVSPARRFDLGKYPRGESRTVRFAKPGVINVYCDIHSDMAAFILVLPNRAFARPRPDGSWELPEVPPGRYTLCWWHPDFAGGKREIEIPAGGAAAVELGFTP